MATDTFTGSGALAADWVLVNNPGADTLVRASDRLVGVGNSGNVVYRWVTDTYGANQYSQLTFVSQTSGNFSYVGVGCRLSSSGTGYVFRCRIDAAEMVLGHYDGTTVTNLGSSPLATALANGDVMRIEANGTTIRALINGSEVLTATDSTYSSGQPGLFWRNGIATCLCDNWEGAALSGGSVTGRARNYYAQS